MSRREKILESLRAGNKIRRQWKGSNLSGYLSHQLEGVPRLRESEVDELGDLVIAQRFSSYAFPPLRLRTDEDRAEEAKQKAVTEAAERAREQERLERDQRLGDLADALEAVANNRFIVKAQDGYVELWRNGFKYRITEVEEA